MLNLLSGFIGAVFDQVLTNSIHLCCDHTLNTPHSFAKPFFVYQWCRYPYLFENMGQAQTYVM